MKRGQNIEEIKNLTKRTCIWPHVLKKSSESPITGHGYAVSRLTMGEVPEAGFQPYHCHSEVLEALLNMGLLGLVPLIIMLTYNLKWIKDFSRLQSTFSRTLALHAICVAVLLLVSLMFEAKLAGKLSPIQPLFLFYLLTLDREKHLIALEKLTEKR
jgi:O-antigen ligase